MSRGRILRRDARNGNADWRTLSTHEAEAIERVRLDDAAWFEARPRRSHRTRPAIPHELPGLTAEMAEGTWIAVRQVLPGLRLRQIFTPPGPPPDVEAVAHALFDLITEHAVTGEREIMPEAIRARVAMLAAGGRA